MIARRGSQQAVTWCMLSFGLSLVDSTPMSRTSQPDLFEADAQPDLFGTEVVRTYRPDSDKVRARLHRILSEARAARTLPWEPARASLYRTIFPPLSLFLPEDEGAQRGRGCTGQQSEGRAHRPRVGCRHG